jgi:hypothetical protein
VSLFEAAGFLKVSPPCGSEAEGGGGGILEKVRNAVVSRERGAGAEGAAKVLWAMGVVGWKDQGLIAACDSVLRL